MRKIRFSQKQFALLCAVVLVAVSVVAMVRQSGWMSDAQRELSGNTITVEPQETETINKANKVEQKDTAKKDDSNTQPAAKAQQPEAKVTSQDSYAYTAKSGDSYTALARDAITQYAKAKKIEVTAAQQLQAEVELVNAASAPLLDIGQVVSISQTDVAAAIDEHKVVGAESTPVEEPAASKTTTEELAEAPSTDTFEYTAAAGDSYTTLARDATRKYADTHDIDLSPAQRLYVETHLAVMANSPMIEVGEQVVFTESNLATYVKQASQLSLDQQSNWKIYLPASGL